VVGGDVFDIVCFVENDVLIGGEESDVLCSQREVGEEDGVIADEEVGGLHASAGHLVEAFFVIDTSFSHAIVGIGAHAIPDIGSGDLGEGGEGAFGCFVGPVFDGVERLSLGCVGEEGGLSFACELEASEGEVVGATFDEDGGEFVGEGGLE